MNRKRANAQTRAKNPVMILTWRSIRSLIKVAQILGNIVLAPRVSFETSIRHHKHLD
jgi:hypothetical protein